ncbi:MAG: KH domain-containing protein [archaeon]
MVNLKFEDEILIPKVRVAVLIGVKGAVKRKIELHGHCKLKIDREGLVKITAHDALELMVSKNVVEAIGRGFNPEIAQNLFKEDNGYELLNLYDYGAKDKYDLKRIRGVVIGAEGSARKVIEQITHTNISVYGKTVAIIGPHATLQKARQAVEMLLTRARHATVFRFLEKKGKAERSSASFTKVKNG